MSMRLHVHSWGSGPRAVLVHGSVLGGRESWRAQRPLTERWTLLAPDRPGHGRSPHAGQDFEPEAALIVDQLLEEPAHLVGHSYGAIVAAYAAAARPEAISSLTLIEPVSTALARGVEAVDQLDAALRELCADSGGDPVAALGRFFDAAGVPYEVPVPLPLPLEQGARALVTARPPGEAEIPLAALRKAPFPVLVISGGHSGAFEAISDAMAAGTEGERAVIEGGGHVVQDTGEPFNARLEAFWEESS